MNTAWEEPARDSQYLCEDGEVRTWAELVQYLQPDLLPCCERDYDILLWCYGAEAVA